MKIELYSVSNDKNAELIKEFLIRNNLKFHETITDDINLLSKIAQARLLEKISLLKIRFRSAIHVHTGFNEIGLNQLLEHIKKYNPKIE